MNTRIFGIVICLILSAELAGAQTPSDSKAKSNAAFGFLPPPLNQWNKFPNWGNVGIGTTSPSEDLEVIGNVKISQTTFTQALQSSSFINSATLNLSGNGIINGNLGLGVSAPTERLDILGNIKLSGTLSAHGLNIQTLNGADGVFNTLTVNQGSLFKGATAFHENVSFSNNALIAGKLGIGITTPSESLDVLGNIKSSQGLFSAEINSGTASFNTVSVSSSASFADKVGIGTNTPAEKLDVVGNLKVSQGISAATLTAEKLDVGQINVTGTTLFNNLNVIGTLNGENLAVAEVNASGNATIGQGLNVLGTTELKNGATITGDATVTGGLRVIGTFSAGSLNIDNVSTSGDATVSQNLSVLGAGQVAGDLVVNGNLNTTNIKAGIIEATEFKTTGGGSPFNFDNAKINETLAVGTDKAVPSNYKVAVGGNIIASGIDLKVPQRWPDYVFTDGHNLLSIEEVKRFIEAHGHLPNVLSAEEMKAKENYSVTEMDAKLLEKIEELTLYIIRQNEEMEKMKKEIDALKQNK